MNRNNKSEAKVQNHEHSTPREGGATRSKRARDNGFLIAAGGLNGVEKGGRR